MSIETGTGHDYSYRYKYYYDLKNFFLTDEAIDSMANSCIEYAFKAVYDNHKNELTMERFPAYPDVWGVNSSGNQYTYVPANDSIYVNNIKIAENIQECNFEKITENDKTKIKVTMSGENDFQRTTTYTLVE